MENLWRVFLLYAALSFISDNYAFFINRGENPYYEIYWYL